jgi:uncharacterized tellurite resistance protein B-like protein
MAGRLFGSAESSRDSVVDMVLMVALADGTIAQATLDRIARALESIPELEGLDWDHVMQRAQELSLDAPLFSDARTSLAAALDDSSERDIGIALAAGIVAADRPLEDSERAILYSIGEALDLSEKQVDELAAKKVGREVVGRAYLRGACNDPDDPQAPNLFDAIAKAKSDPEVRMLMYKLAATRRIVDEILIGSSIAGVCEVARVGAYQYRADALLDMKEGGRCIVRFLADGEAMFPGEHRVLSALQARLNEPSFLMIAHQGDISPPDAAFIRGLDSTRLRVQRIEL